MRKPKTVFAESNDGQLFVKAQAIMSPLCAMIDGIEIATFPKDKNIYLKIDVAIKWVEQEMQYHSKEKYTKILAALNLAKKQHADGTMEYTDKSRKGR